jgi:serine/threonine-protein kinase
VAEVQVIAGRYEVIRKLGQGGMGTVYECRHVATGKRVAVKVVTGELAKDSRMVARFELEARAAGKIDSEHIVQVFDAGRDEKTGLPFMTMEFLVGEDLAELFRRTGPLSPDAALRIVGQVGEGLAKAHEHAIVHRDIKPGNVFLSKRGDKIVPKILDFGIAKVLGESAQRTEGESELTRTGNVLGSPHYMSPEQAQGLRNIDARSDVWSLGVVLFRALTGRTPQAGVESLGQMIIAICSKPSPLVQDLAPWVGPEIAAIVERSLEIDPDHRFQSMNDMLRAVRAICPSFDLTPSMLAPLPDEVRISIAERHQSGKPRVRLEDETVNAPLSAGGHLHGSVTGVAQSDTGPQNTTKAVPRRFVGALVVGLSVVALAAAAISLRRADRASADAGPSTAPPAVSVATSPSAAASAAPPNPTPSAEGPSPTARVAVPANAIVLVDGSPAALDDGAVFVKGDLGSVHRVTLRVGAREGTYDVVVSDHGAIPPRLVLDATATPIRRPADGTPPATASRPPSTPPPTSTKRGKNDLATDSFE